MDLRQILALMIIKKEVTVIKSVQNLWKNIV